MVRRREIAQPRMRFAGDALCKRRGQPRLADAGLAGDQHDPALTGLGLPPAALEQVEFLVAADQRRRLRAQCLEAADDAAFADHLPGMRPLGEAGERLRPEAFDLALTADLAACPIRDDDPVRPGDRLQAGREVRRLADDPALLRRTLADQVADDDEAARDAEAHRELR